MTPDRITLGILGVALAVGLYLWIPDVIALFREWRRMAAIDDALDAEIDALEDRIKRGGQ